MIPFCCCHEWLDPPPHRTSAINIINLSHKVELQRYLKTSQWPERIMSLRWVARRRRLTHVFVRHHKRGLPTFNGGGERLGVSTTNDLSNPLGRTVGICLSNQLGGLLSQRAPSFVRQKTIEQGIRCASTVIRLSDRASTAQSHNTRHYQHEGPCSQPHAPILHPMWTGRWENASKEPNHALDRGHI